MKQEKLFDAPVLTIREYVIARLQGLEWRQRARVERRARRRRSRGRGIAGGGLPVQCAVCLMGSEE